MNGPTRPPVLQPPGAGLPWVVRMVARHIVFPRTCRKLTWAAAAELFQTEGQMILKRWEECPADRRTERVLIRPMRGLEDSSRYWSVAMTVEHLNIVGPSIRKIIAALRQGVVPPGQARTQDVKPLGESDPAQVLEGFVRQLSETAAAEAAEPPIPPKQGPRFPHPWFGPLDAHQWHCLLGMHQGIHRRQIEAILAGLK